MKLYSFDKTVQMIYKRFMEQYCYEDLVEKYVGNIKVVEQQRNKDINSFCYTYPNGVRYAYQRVQGQEVLRMLDRYWSEKITIETFSYYLIEYSIKQLIDTILLYERFDGWNCLCKISEYQSKYARQYTNEEEYLYCNNYLLTDGVYDYVMHIYSEISNDGGYITCANNCKRVSDFCFIGYNLKLALINNTDELLYFIFEVLEKQIKTMIEIRLF